MEEHRTRKRYDRQFKVDAVRLMTEEGRSVASVSRDLGVGTSQLQRWKREAQWGWASDITDIWRREEWLYLAVVLDLCSRAIVGWATSAHVDAELVCVALRRALKRKQPAAEVTSTLAVVANTSARHHITSMMTKSSWSCRVMGSVAMTTR